MRLKLKIVLLFLLFIENATLLSQTKVNNSFDKETVQKINTEENYAHKTNLSLKDILSKINAAIIIQDTTQVYQLFYEGKQIAKEKNVAEHDDDFLKLKIKEIYYHVRQGKISSEKGLSLYQNIYVSIKATDKHTVIAEVLGRISLLYRNRKELGKALNYNALELDFAKKSNNAKEIASAKITELDLSYQLIPRPIKSEDVIPLIKKAKVAEAFMKKHQILDILPFTQLYLAKFYIHETSYKKGEDLLNSISDSLNARIIFSKYEQLCEIAKSTNNLKTYRKYTLKFKPVAYKTKRPFVALNVHNYLVDFFVKSHQKDSAIFYTDLLEKNLQKVDTTQFLDYVYFSYDVLSNHFLEFDKTKSIQYKDYANRITQQIVDNQKEAFVNIIKYREEVENLQDKNSNLKATISAFQNNLASIITIVFILLAFVLYYFKAYKRSNEKSKTIEEEKEEIIKKTERKNIILNNGQKIYLDDIKYVKSDRNYVEFYYNDKKMMDRNHLKNVLEQLPPNFIKTHRSYIVNKNFIKVINSNSLILTSNIEIPVSRTFKNNVKV